MIRTLLASDRRVALLVFTLLTIAGMGLQLWIIPHLLPQLDDGAGFIQRSDASLYHKIALQLLGAMRAQGWAAWQPAPYGLAMPGLLAALYYLTIPCPLMFIPIAAFAAAMAACAIIDVGARCGIDRRAMRLSALISVLFPTMLLWMLQLGKEAFCILGLFLILRALLSTGRFTPNTTTLTTRQVIWHILTGLFGIGCLLLLRSYALTLIALGLTTGSLCWAILSLLHGDNMKQLLRPLLVTLLTVALLLTASLYLTNGQSDNSWGAIRDTVEAGKDWSTNQAAVEAIRNSGLPPLPSAPAIAHRITPASIAQSPGGPMRLLPRRAISYLRYMLARRLDYVTKASGATLNIDADSLATVDDMLPYLPRAAAIACCLPLPWQAFTMPPGASRLFTLVMGLEMLVIYIGWIGLAWGLLRLRLPRALCAMLVILFAAMVLPAVISAPNLGTLHRTRFAPLMMLATLGWGALIERYLTGRWRD